MSKVYLIIALAALIALYYYSQFTIKTTHYKIKTDKNIKKPIKIIQISDLHNNKFGKDQSKLINIVKKEKPDFVVFTGDMVNHGEYFNSMFLGGSLTMYCPVYYVTGNHEHYMKKHDMLFMLNEFEKMDVNVINNTVVPLKEFGLDIIGLQGDKNSLDNATATFNMATMVTDHRNFKLLLAHEPQYFEKFIDEKSDIDLVLTGHAHGGQWVLPIVRQGTYAPDQGMFPKYTEGLHSYKSSKMIVSRGVGTMIKIPRIFNRPEVVCVEVANESNSAE